MRWWATCAVSYPARVTWHCSFGSSDCFPHPRASPRHRPRGPSTARGPKAMPASLISILDGNTFVVSDTRGDIEPSRTDPTGLFSFDTRFLSRWVLTVNGERLNPLSV